MGPVMIPLFIALSYGDKLAYINVTQIDQFYPADADNETWVVVNTVHSRYNISTQDLLAVLVPKIRPTPRRSRNNPEKG